MTTSEILTCPLIVFPVLSFLFFVIFVGLVFLVAFLDNTPPE